MQNAPISITRRPVPSFAALRALRHLAYVASGTACGAAAIIYEERRRRIKFLKQVAENARVIKRYVHVTSQQRRGVTATSAIENVDDDYGDVLLNYRENAKRETGFGCGHEDIIPSRIDRHYKTWIKSSKSSEEDGKILANTDHRGNVNEDQTLKKKRFDNQKPLDRRKNISDTLGITPNSTAKDLTYGIGLQLRPILPFFNATTTVRRWKERLQTLPGHKRADLSKSWQLVLDSIVCENSESSEHDDTIGYSVAGPLPEDEKLEYMLLKAVELKLPELLLRLCQYAEHNSTHIYIATHVTDLITEASTPKLFSETRRLLLVWSRIVPSNSCQLDALDRLWMQMKLLDTNTTANSRILSSTLTKILCLTDHVDVATQFQTMLRTMLQNKTAIEVVNYYRACLEPGNSTALMHGVVIPWLFKWLIEKAQIRACHDLVLIATECNIDTKPYLDILWTSAVEELDLIDLYERFGLHSCPSRAILGKLFEALLRYCSGNTIVSELYGVHGQVWTATLVQRWRHTSEPLAAINTYRKLRGIVGERIMNEVLHEAITFVCEQYDLHDERREIMLFKNELWNRLNNSQQVANIIKLAERGQWTAVRNGIEHLNSAGFGTMPCEARVRLFDPLLKTFAHESKTLSELIEFSRLLFKKIDETASPLTEHIYLSDSMVRCGRVYLLPRIHDFFKSSLNSQLTLTPTHVNRLLRSYFYTFRPSPVLLASLLCKLYKSKWLAASRFCIPLLLISCSHEYKKRQRQDFTLLERLVSDVLLNLDNPGFRSSMVRKSLANQMTPPELLPSGEVAMPEEVDAYPTKASGRSIVYSNSEQDFQEPLLEESPNRYLFVEPKQIQQDKYFQYWSAKALLHHATSRNYEHSAAEIYRQSVKASLFPPTAVMSSLVTSVSNKAGRTSIAELAKTSGGKTAMALSADVIATIGESQNRGFNNYDSHLHQSWISRFSNFEQITHARHGHSSESSTMIAYVNRSFDVVNPSSAIELPREMLRLPYSSILSKNRVALSVMLRYYIRKGNLHGIRWAFGQLIANDIELDTRLLRLFDKCIEQFEAHPPHLSKVERAIILDEINAYKTLCLIKQRQQMVLASDIGHELINYLALNAQDGVSSLGNSKLAAKSLKQDYRERWIDASIVNGLCEDILIKARKSQQSSTYIEPTKRVRPSLVLHQMAHIQRQARRIRSSET